MGNSTAQTKIKLIQDCVKVCSAIYNFNFESIAIIANHTGLPVRRVSACLDKTNEQELTWKDGSKYGLLEAGREYVRGMLLNSGVGDVSNYSRYKDEALSGIVEIKSPKSGHTVSRRSKIDRAVLPALKKQHTSRTPEDFIVEQDMERKGRERVAKHIGITIQELEEAHGDGLIAICKGCDRLELFHRHGKYRQDKCIKCRKKSRK